MKNIFVAAIFLTVSVFLVFGFVLPRKAELDALQERVSDVGNQVKIKENYFSSLRDISNSLDDYLSQLSKIDSALPRESQLPVFYDFLQKTSSQSGLVLNSISSSPSKLSEIEGIKETSVVFTVSGSYSSFKTFLVALENSSRMIFVENISSSDSSNFNLKVKIYSY